MMLEYLHNPSANRLPALTSEFVRSSEMYSGACRSV